MINLIDTLFNNVLQFHNVIYRKKFGIFLREIHNIKKLWSSPHQHTTVWGNHSRPIPPTYTIPKLILPLSSVLIHTLVNQRLTFLFLQGMHERFPSPKKEYTVLQSSCLLSS